MPCYDQSGKNQAPREHVSTLNAAVLRIGATLDVHTLLHEVVQCARDLTGARYGVIATVDESGTPQDLIFSGLTAEEEQDLAAWPDSGRLFDQLKNLDAPLRLTDLSAYVQGLGIVPAPMFAKTFQGTPMRHMGADVGNLLLAEKADDEEFTDHDEEILVLFAAQAAAAIANARAHRREQRAHAELEALVETSPVGVVVFDGPSGKPISFNQEARRIVESLRTPGHPTEQLLDVITCRRADGREVSLTEFPLAKQFDSPETVRSEEVELSVKDGRSVRTLINVTPIPGGGSTTTVVVTMQDLTPLDEAERLRTEFLALVSHELRQPLTSIKGSAVTLLEESERLDRAEMHEFHRIIAEQTDHMRGLVADLLDAGRIEAGTLSVAPEPAEIGDLVERARDAFVGGSGRHAILIDLPPDLPNVMADRRRIVQVLNNLFANAARHAPVSTPIRVAAMLDDTHVAVSITDEGRGVAPELLPHLFRNRTTGKETSGKHGLGLAICRGLVEAHGGRIRAESPGVGRGTKFVFSLPVVGESVNTLADVPRGAPTSMGGVPPRILVVDDDPRILRFVRDALSAAGYAPLVTGVSQNLAQIIRTEKPRLVLLDLMFPGEDGIDLMRSMPELSDLPVIFISGYGRDETVARALDAGATDYIVKPFSPTELVARVRAAIRRHEEPEPFVLGNLAIDYDRRHVTIGGDKVELTATEYELLCVLSRSAGRVVTHDTLLRRVWSGRKSDDANLVRIFIRNLRAKLGDNAVSPDYIFNERGVGYRMAAPGEG